MSRLITGDPVRRYAGPPADRMAGRPSQLRAAKAAAAAAGGEDGEALIARAVHCGVIGANLAAHYAELYSADPEGTRSYLHALGLRPAHGTAPRQTAATDAYPTAGLSRAERERIAAAQEGRTPRYVNGGL
jgi:hypothetical protein